MIAGARKLAETLEKNGSSLVGIQSNLVDLVWGKDRPSRPQEKVRVHPVEYAGKPFQEKIAELRKELETKKKAGFVVCMSFSRPNSAFQEAHDILQPCWMKLPGCST